LKTSSAITVFHVDVLVFHLCGHS